MYPHWLSNFTLFFDTVCKSIALSMASCIAGDDMMLIRGGSLTVEPVAEDPDAVLFNFGGRVFWLRRLELLCVEDREAFV